MPKFRNSMMVGANKFITYFTAKEVRIEFYAFKSPQGAGLVIDPSQKFPVTMKCIFRCGMTWGTMFTKVILLAMAEA